MTPSCKKFYEQMLYTYIISLFDIYRDTMDYVKKEIGEKKSCDPHHKQWKYN